MSILPAFRAEAAPQQLANSCSWLHANGEAADAIRAHDWTTTCLGPTQDWPMTLRMTLNLVLNSPFSIFIAWGEDWRCFYNDAFGAMLGGSGSGIGLPLDDVFPEALDKLTPMFAKAMDGEATFDEGLLLPMIRDGKLHEMRWVVSCSPIRDDLGTICGVFVPVLEVTAKIEAEERLRGSEENLQIMSSLVPGFLWRHNGRVDAWTDQPMQDTHSSIDPKEMVHPDDQAAVAIEWKRAQQAGDRFQSYHRLKAPDGDYRWHAVLAEPVHNAAGEIEEWIGMATDIHDYRVAADDLAENSALLRSFTGNSVDAIWILNVESKQLEFLSPTFALIWGRESSDHSLHWDDWLAMLHPDDRDHHALTFERLMSGEVLHEKYRILRPDGSVRWLRDTMFPIIGPDGAVHRLGGIAQDITQISGQTVYLIDSVAESSSRLSLRLKAMGFQVRPFASIDGFLRLRRALPVGCVVAVDAQGGELSDRLAAELKGQCGSLPLILVCQVRDASKAIQLMKQGVSDIILADDPPERLDRAIASALAIMQTESGENNLVRNAKERMRPLSEREREILQCLGGGATNKMVARDLGLSPRTVETYRVRILEKLGVSSLPEAVRIATLAEL